MQATAVNPETGERLTLQNGQWVPSGAQTQAQQPQQPFTIGSPRQPAPRAPEQQQLDQLRAQRLQQQIGETTQGQQQEVEGRQLRANETLERGQGALQIIDRMLADVNPTTTGLFGSVLSNIPGTAAHDLSGDVETIGTLIGMDALERARQSSAVGASGFGNLSNREWSGLQASIATLRNTQSNERLEENLRIVRDRYERYLNAVRMDLGMPEEQGSPEMRPDLSSGLSGLGTRAGGRQVVTNDPQGGGDPSGTQAFQRAWGMVQQGAPLADIDRAVREASGFQLDINNPAWQAYEAARSQPGFDPEQYRPTIIGDTNEQFEEARIDPITSAALGAGDVITAGNLDELAPGSTEDFRAIQGAAQEQQGDAYFGGQIGGSFALPIGRIRTAGQAAGVGGAYGGAYGYGSAEGNVAERLPEAALGAGIGATTGYALQRYGAPLIERGIEAGGNIANRVGRNLPGAERRAQRATERGQDATISANAARAAQEQDVPLYRPDVDPRVRNEFSALETGPAGDRIRTDLARTDTGVQQRMAGLSPGTPLDDVGMGTAVREGAERFIDRSRGTAGRLYQRAERMTGDVRVDPARTLAQLDDELANLARSPNTNAAEIRVLQGLRDDIAGGNSIDAFRRLRSDLRTTLQQNNLTSTPAEARITGVLGTLSDDINTAVQSQGSPGAQRAWQRADQFYRDRASVVNGVFRQVLGPRNDRGAYSAERIANNLRSLTRKDSSRLSQLMNRLSPEERNDITATLAREIGTNTQGNFTMPQFVRQVENMEPAAITALFGREGAQTIQGLRDIARARVRTEGAINRPNTGRSVNYRNILHQTLFGGGAGYAATGTGTGAAVGALIGSKVQSAIERLTTSRRAALVMDPDFVRWVRSAPATNSAGAVDRHLARLNRIVAANDNAAVGAIGQRAVAEDED